MPENNNKAAEWREVSRYLDEALELYGEARVRWLRELEAREPVIAARVAELLAERDQAGFQNFLSERPTPQLPDCSLEGQQLGAYTLKSPLGRGGMGAVWLALRSDGRFEGSAAIKLLNAALINGPAGQRFVREGSVLATLKHPNIARLTDAGIAPGGQPYLVLEYVDGVRIDTYCEQHGLSVEARVRLFLDVLAAVAHAHSHLVVHRDLKPSNILVTADGMVKLLDFGVAALLAPTATEVTREAVAALTPEYAAPEQLLGRPATTATDVYALGLVLFVLLVGRHPASPESKSAAEFLRSTLEHDAPLLSDVAPDARLLRGDLDNIVAMALKKAPEERYTTADAFARDLRCYLSQEPVSAHADSFSYRAGKFISRHRAGIATASIVALALIAATSFALVQMLEARKQRDEAREQTERAEGFNTVITSLLSQVGPGGRSLTPEELLDRAVVAIQRQYAADPPTLVHLLTTVSGRYYDLRNTQKEYTTLVAADAVARQAKDPALIVSVQCDTVETELYLGRPTAARQRIDEARRLIPSLKDIGAGEQADCLRAEAEVARSEGDLPAAIRHLQTARQTLEAAGRTWGNRYSGILSMLEAFNAMSGHNLEAHRIMLELQALDKRYGREASVGGLIGRSSMAYSLYRLGQVQQAQTLFDKSLDKWSAPGSSTPINASVAYRFGEILSRMEHHDKALELLQSSVTQADSGGNHTIAIRARLKMVAALLRAGRLDDAQRMLDETTQLLKAEERPEPSMVLSAAHVQAQIWLAQERVDEANGELSGVLESLGYPKDVTNPLLAPVLLTHARMEMMRSRYQVAIDNARTALDLFAKNTLDRQQSADVGEALLVLAQAEAASGMRAAGQAKAIEAQRILAKGLGATHTLTRQAVLLTR